MYCFEKYSLKWEEHILLDESYKSEYEVLISNPKLIKSIGWEPNINIYKLADLMLEAAIKNKITKT